MNIITEHLVRELKYKASIYNAVGSAWELNRAEAMILQALLLRAADTIEFLLERLSANNGWIPCSERLPDTRNNILICQRDGYVSIGYYSQDKFLDLESYPFEDVVAWQPLPEAYHE